jgi:DNA-binding transcriptional regulator YhcF (GntR family)
VQCWRVSRQDVSIFVFDLVWLGSFGDKFCRKEIVMIEKTTIHFSQDGEGQGPLHRRIAEVISKKVVTGELTPGSKLPSERQIAQQFSASRATVRTALQHLEQAGQIVRRDRRSAVVSLQRNLKPSLRIAFTDSRLLEVFRCLAQKQILPARSQLKLIDMRESLPVSRLVTQPASGADILVCDLEYLCSTRCQRESFVNLPFSITGDVQIPDTLQKGFVDDGGYTAVPLGISPVVLYYNRQVFSHEQVSFPVGPWHWDQLADMARRFVTDGSYGLQAYPCFAHMSALAHCFGGSLYDSDGNLTAGSSPAFEVTIRFLHRMLYVDKTLAPLTRSAGINLFAQRRCAMAIDGFDMLEFYRRSLGGDLGVAVLPGAPSGGMVTQGIFLAALSSLDNVQPIEDLVRILLNTHTQRTLLADKMTLPVRLDLLRPESLQEVGIAPDVAAMFTAGLANARVPDLPACLDDYNNLESLLTELWLGLDSIDSICQRFRSI